MDKHSEKGLKTLTLLGTISSDWGLVEIIWKLEKCLVPTKVFCSSCQRVGRCHVDQEGKPFDFFKYPWTDKIPNWDRRSLISKYNLVEVQCPVCPSRRGRGQGYGTGEVTKMVEREVWIGYVQWEQGTLFDSRFGGGNHCGLCSKMIKQSGFVPVHGKDSQGKVHGMWVGQDCARKFFGIKKWKKDTDAILNRGDLK